MDSNNPVPGAPTEPTPPVTPTNPSEPAQPAPSPAPSPTPADPTAPAVTPAQPTIPPAVPGAPVDPAQPGGVVSGQMVTPAAPMTTVLGGNSYGKKSKNSMLIGIVIAVLVVLGVGATAYFGFIVPAKPENIMRDGVVNTFQAETMETKASFKFGGETSETISKLEVSVFGSREKTDASYKMVANTSFGDYTVDAVTLDNKLYFKVGGLKDSENLITSLFGGSQSARQMSNYIISLDGQWWSVDESALKEYDVKLEETLLSEEDSKKIVDAYKAHPFITPKEKLANEKVGDKNAYHLKVGFDKEQLKEFVKMLKGTKLAGEEMTQEDIDDTVKEIDESDAADWEKYSLEVWVDKGSRRLVQVRYSDKESENESDHYTVTANFSKFNEELKLKKPDGAKPITELMAGFEQALGGQIEVADPSGSGLGDGVLGTFDFNPSFFLPFQR